MKVRVKKNSKDREEGGIRIKRIEREVIEE